MGEAAGATVLLIDDDPSLLKITGKQLEHWGYRVLTASDGEHGVTLAKDQHPDAILLDFNMPVMTGPEALQTLKQDPDMADIPVIMLTGKESEHDKDMVLGLGAFAHVPKPYRPEELSQHVEAAVQEHRSKHPP